MNKKQLICNIILVVCVIILVNIGVFYCGFISGEEYYMQRESTITTNIYNMINNVNFEQRKLRICSDNATLSKGIGMSMFYYSWEGGYSYSDKIEFNEIEIGDIITFRKNNQSIHHAVINKYKDYLITAGYGNNNPDNFKVYPEEIISRDCFMMNPNDKD